jgi:hypothetical protein
MEMNEKERNIFAFEILNVIHKYNACNFM